MPIDSIDGSLIASLHNFKPHPMAQKYIMSKASTRVNIKGNQGGGTATAMFDMSLRLLGMHPVKERNRIEAPIRCVSKCLPKNEDDEENQQYVEFKKMFPPELIVKDITFRTNNLVLRDSNGGKDRKVEFMSKKQEIDAFMSVQRQTLYQDEEIEKQKWDENQMRLLAYDGDTNLTLTPVRGLDWTYDQIWCRAKRIHRSPVIAHRFGFPLVEEFDRESDIEVFCWATDDNPIMDKGAIERIFSEFDDNLDADEIAMRRYGVFRQVSGRIYKEFDTNIHVIPWEHIWDAKLFGTFWHYRMVDYHQSKPWYISWVAVTPQHEWFVWNEVCDRADTDEMRDRIKAESLLPEYDEFNRRTLFDPLAREAQSNTTNSESMFDHIQKGPHGLRMCEVADTKNQQARNNIIRRLRNSLYCEVPFNNEAPDDVIVNDPRHEGYLPTIWFFDTCRGHIEHFRNWRTIEYKQEHTRAEKDEKRIMQRWSDYCRNIEFLGAVNPVFYTTERSPYIPKRFFHRETAHP
jgi:hypothetical protein